MVHRIINDIEIPYFLWKKILPIKNVKQNIAFDTETIDGKAFLISDSKERHRNDQEFKNLYGLLEYLTYKDYRKTVNWFYNLEYDTNAIIHRLSFDDRVHIAEMNWVDYKDYRIEIIPKKQLKIGKVRNDKISHAVSYFDLAQFYNYLPLKLLAEKTTHTKVDVDDITHININKYYSEKEYETHINNRCIIDCKITKELADKLTNNIQKVVKLNNYRSNASISRRYVLENIKHQLKMPNTKLLDCALQTYHAGHIETCALGTFQNVNNYDINCFDAETELLTEKGFKKWDKFTKEDNAATLNLESGCIEYQNILHIHKHKYDGYLLHQKNENLDIMVTPNHRIYYQVHDRAKAGKNYNGYSDYKVSMFKDTPNGNIRIPTNGMHPAGTKPDIDKDWIKLCAWVITEGHFHKDYDRVTIYQSDKYNYQKEIRTILNNANIKFTERNRGIRSKHNYASYEFYIGVKYGRCIRNLLNDKKEIPKEWVLNWDKESLEILFWELMKGDGSFRCQYGKTEFKSYNNHDLDMMNLIAFKIGYKTNINYKTHCLYIKRNTNGNFAITQTTQRKIKVPYNGMVWCITTPNDTIVVRRNGKIFITGNSAYPSFTANLYETSGSPIHNHEYEPDMAYSFYEIDINYTNEHLSPLWFNKSSNNYHTTGKWKMWATQSEIDYLMFAGHDFKILQAHHIDKTPYTQQPFYDLINDLYQERLKAKENKDEIELVYKIILNSIYGVTLNTIHKKILADYETDIYQIKDGKTIYYDSQYIATNMYNPVYGTYITAQTRSKLFTDFNKYLKYILSINTDGVYITHKVPISISKKLGDYSYKLLPEYILMGSGRYFIKEDGIINDKESRFRSIPKKPSDLYEYMNNNSMSKKISISREKPIKLKESIKQKQHFNQDMGIDNFNVFKEVTKDISFINDKRYWYGSIDTPEELFSTQISSRPFDVTELK